MNTPDTYQLKKLEPNSEYISDFLEGIKNTPELKNHKFIPWFIGIKYVEWLLKNGAEVYGVIANNKKLVGGLILSEQSAPRNTKISQTDANRKATFDELHSEDGYKYASYGYLDESERGKVPIKNLLKEMNQKFYTALRSESVERFMKINGGEEVIQPDGTVMKNIRNGTSYLKYNPENKTGE